MLLRNISVNHLGSDQGNCVRIHSLPTLEVTAVAAAMPESFDLLRIATGRAGLALFEHLLPALRRNPLTKVLFDPGSVADSAVILPVLLRTLEVSGYTISRILDNGQIEPQTGLPESIASTNRALALPVLLVERKTA